MSLSTSTCQSNELFELVTLKSGIKTLRSIDRGETFHPVTGPLEEANILHVQQQNLIERSSRSAKFVIWDIGFGAAANVLAAIDALKLSQTKIEIHSFDKSLKPIEFALNHAKELEYIVPYEDLIRSILNRMEVNITPQVSWCLHLGDFREMVKEVSISSPDALFYDPYSALTNPEMWTVEHFKNLNNRLNSKSTSLLTNYTRSTAVRVSLLLAGFFVGRGVEVGQKAETTIASNHLDGLTAPLDIKWLERVRNSTNSAPLRSSSLYSKSSISSEDFEQLKQHPQFK